MVISKQRYWHYPNCWPEVEVGKQRRKDKERGESCWTSESPASTGGKLLHRTLQRPNDSMVDLMNDRETIVNARGQGEDWRCSEELRDWAATTAKHTGNKEAKVCQVSPTEPVFKEPAQRLSPGTLWLWGKVKCIGFLQTKTATFTASRLS